MSRTADYTILGFLYQFNQTLARLLKSSDEAPILVEGLIEDIDISSETETHAIQCKYHEAKSFTLSAIYEPVLQMMCHYVSNINSDIRYILCAYFPDSSSPSIEESDLYKILETKDRDLKKYVDQLNDQKINIPEFYLRFKFELGKSIDDLEKEVIENLNDLLPGEDIDTLIYPNAINEIAKLSTKHNSNDRRTTRRQFLKRLKGIRTIAISRWTMALKSRDKLLREKKRHLSSNLKRTDRLRYFLVDSESISDFNDEIVKFIRDFLDHYHVLSRPVHALTPIFCLDCSEELFADILRRLRNHVKICSGYLEGPERIFDPDHFFRLPTRSIVSRQVVEREFDVRIVHLQIFPNILKHKKCHDLYVIGNKNYRDNIEDTDVSIEYIDAIEIKDLKTLFGI